MTPFPRRLIPTLLLFFLPAAALLAQAEPERLTIDWIFSDEAREVAPTPATEWRADGALLLYDRRLPKEERTIEALDPRTGKRTAVLDRKAAMTSMTEVWKPKEPLEEPGWPQAFTRDGSRALYPRRGDLYVLELAEAKLHRLTETEAEEKSPRFSPDGTKVAFVRDNDLYVVDVLSGEEKRLTHDGSETLLNGTLSWVYWEELFGRRDRGYAWSPDSAKIAYLQTDDSQVHVMHYVDFKPAEPRVIEQRYPKAGGVNPRVRAGMVDLESGKTTWVDLGSYPYEYLVRYQWVPTSGGLIVQTLNRAQQTLDVFVAETASGAVRHLLRETNAGWIDPHDDLHFSADGQYFLWVSERDGHPHLYLYKSSGELVQQVTRGDWSLSSAASRFSDGLRGYVASVDEGDGFLYFMAREKSPLEVHLYRIHPDGSGMERVTQVDGVHSVDFGPKGVYLDRYSNPTTPPTVVLRSREGEDLGTLVPPNREVADRFGFGTPELVEFEAEDGYKLWASVLRPQRFEPDHRYPAIVSVYGGPAAPRIWDSWSGNPTTHLLAEEGYVVFTVDPRTSTAISKTLVNLALLHGYSDLEASDILAGVRWLKSQPYVDPERVGVTGWSGGGTTTLLLMTTSKEFRAGIAGAPVTDWHYYDTIYTEAFMKRPIDNPEGYESTSHVLRAKDLHGRLMLIHGTYDDNVNPQNTWAMANELIENGILFDMMIYPMRKHGFRDRPAREHVLRKQMEFWERYLKE